MGKPKRLRIEKTLKRAQEGAKVHQYVPETRAIETFDHLWAVDFPAWVPSEAGQVELMTYIQRAELLINGLLSKLIAAPLPRLVNKYASHAPFFERMHRHFIRLLMDNYESLRRPESRDNLIYCSRALNISVLVAKSRYLHDLLTVLSDALASMKVVKESRPIRFEAPFIPVVDSEKGGGPIPMNGETRVPVRFCLVPGKACPYLYSKDVLLYPQTMCGRMTQMQLFYQTCKLAENWDGVDLVVRDEVGMLLTGLFARFMELQSLAFGDGSEELDAVQKLRPEPNRGLHPEAPRIRKQLQFGKAGLEINDSAASKEVKRLVKRQRSCMSLGSEYQIHMLGMLMPMMVDVEFGRTKLRPSLVTDNVKTMLAMYVVASLVRFVGGAELLYPEGVRATGTGQANPITIPIVYGTPLGELMDFPEEVSHDYQQAYEAVRSLLLEKQKTPLDDTSKRALCTEMRLAQIPYGASEGNCVTNGLRWSTERRDLEDYVIPKARQTYQMVNWESRPLSFFLSAGMPLSIRFLVAQNILDAVTSSHAVQRRPCSKDALVASHLLGIGQMATIFDTRTLPYILQFGDGLFLCAEGKSYPCSNLPEALTVWFMAAYGLTGGEFRNRIGRPGKLPYLEQTMVDIMAKLPDATLARYKRLVCYLLAGKDGLPLEEDDDELSNPEAEAADEDAIFDIINQMCQ